jgi:hypothetical protein
VDGTICEQTVKGAVQNSQGVRMAEKGIEVRWSSRRAAMAGRLISWWYLGCCVKLRSGGEVETADFKELGSAMAESYIEGTSNSPLQQHHNSTLN